MSKRIPILIVVVVLVLLAAPYAIGMFTESRLSDRIESYNASPTITASVDSYERGWRTSRAVLHMSLTDNYLQQIPGAAAMLQGFDIPIIVEFEHGPLLLDDGVGLGTTRVRAYVDQEWQIAQLAQQFLGIPYLFELRGRAGFGTGFDFEGEIPPFDNALGDISYSFSGLDFSGRMDGVDVEIEGLLENAALQSPDVSAILESLSMSGDYVYERERLPLGTAELAIARMTATNPLLGAAPLFAANNLAMTTTMAEQDDNVEFSLGYSADLISMADTATINDWAMGFTASNIDAEAMHGYYALMNDPNVTADPVALEAQMMPLLDRIVAGSPQVSVEPFRFSMPSGELDGNLLISVDGSTLPNGSAMDLQDLAVMMGALDAELDVTASKALAQELAAIFMREQIETQAMQTGQRLSDEELDAMAAAQAGLVMSLLAAQGILADRGDMYSSQIEFHDGNLTANGQPLQGMPMGGF